MFCTPLKRWGFPFGLRASCTLLPCGAAITYCAMRRLRGNLRRIFAPQIRSNQRMGLIYSHRVPDWPNYTWDHTTFSADLAAVHFRRGQLVVAMAALGIEARQETVLSVLGRMS